MPSLRTRRRDDHPTVSAGLLEDTVWASWICSSPRRLAKT